MMNDSWFSPLWVCRAGAACSAAWFLASAPLAHAALAGAWDAFDTEAHAQGWSVYDFADDEFYLPFWEAGADPFIFTFHTDDEPLWFVSGEVEQAGGGALIGDFHAQGIRAIRVDAFIDSPEDLFEVDCGVSATGPAGRRYYYAQAYWGEDFDDAGWWTLEFPFDEEWYYLENNVRVPVAMTPELLASIEEISFGFYPLAGSFDLEAAIDNVILEPTVTAPPLETAAAAGEFRLAFTPAPGNVCAIEELRVSPTQQWVAVAGHEAITGGEHVFTVATLPGSRIFRVASEANYTVIGPP